MVSEATKYIKKCLGGGSKDAIAFCGSGATAAVKRLQEVMAVSVPSTMRDRMLKCLLIEERWVVFVGPYEHHSNLLSWRQSLVEALVRLLHEYGAFACFDFAASGLYVEIGMRSGDIESYDAIFLVPHKFLGGPGSSGILLMSKALYQLKSCPPSTCGRGRVDYVNGFNEKDTLYNIDFEEREDAGESIGSCTRPTRPFEALSWVSLHLKTVVLDVVIMVLGLVFGVTGTWLSLMEIFAVKLLHPFHSLSNLKSNRTTTTTTDISSASHIYSAISIAKERVRMKVCKRRSRINVKMKALQNLVLNSNKIRRRYWTRRSSTLNSFRFKFKYNHVVERFGFQFGVQTCNSSKVKIVVGKILYYLSSNRIIHRYMKPQNVLTGLDVFLRQYIISKLSLNPVHFLSGPSIGNALPPACTLLSIGQAFAGTLNVSSLQKDKVWRVNVQIQGCDLDHGYLCGTMEAPNVPMADTSVMTFGEGKIVDTKNYTFFTGKWEATYGPTS
ncbi:hypothetical protein GIB67_036073 [Kingdonia uniflora]|uniref:Aminotransferase class V domain-containing protein n=1 Tax=Kingdonia uniflora TaxID=39325 RepID=A0A7J7N941_9MAGN|nr:hypothetical protein GIB67_036073 [Kingdonia uniflora]